MVKKVVKDSTVFSPKKDLISGKPSVEPSHNDENNLNLNNMVPISNDQKKTKKEGQNGSNQTQDNQQIEEERGQTNVNEFNFSIVPSGDDQNPGLGDPPGPGESGDDESQPNEGTEKKKTEYLKFFKFYYEKTKTQHPNWTPSQITKIISLLWKKKKNIEKAPSKANSTTSRRSNKPLAPKDAFRLKHKELSKEDVDNLWSKLPKESKNFWKKEGNSYCTVSAKSSDVSSIKDCKSSAPIYNNMRALLKNY